MTTLREAAQQALDYWEQVAWGDAVMVDKMDALRAALAEQDDDLTAAWMAGAAEERKRAALAEQDRGSGWCPIHQHYKPCAHNTAAQAQPLTIERLRDALVASRIIDPGAVEDPDNYDDGVTLHRIEALFRRIA